MFALTAWWWEAAQALSGITGPAAARRAAPWLVAGTVTILWVAAAAAADVDDPFEDPTKTALVREGRTLFNHTWTKGDKLAAGGDGLGPVFNGTSCVQCHEQGGIGGAGPVEANVQVLSGTGIWKTAELQNVHVGLIDHPHVVLHKSGTSSDYKRWHDSRLKLAASPRQQPADATPEPGTAERNLREGMRRQSEGLAALNDAMILVQVDRSPLIVADRQQTVANPAARFPRKTVVPVPPEHRGVKVSDRSTTSLFGAGLIDKIPDGDIEQAARDEVLKTPRTVGHVSRLANKQIGRFGWHAQVASLQEFTVTACAVELGLEVPGHPQAGDPRRLVRTELPRLDLTTAQCEALVAYVAQFPRPIEQSHPRPAQVARGREVFGKIGCADCHRPDLGGVVGLYSDLLLHDMGPELQGGSYGAFAPSGEAEPGGQRKAATTKPRLVSFTAQRAGDTEWRTPPLWGVASSAPYLHDGRAATLTEAIRLHTGQGQASADEFGRLHWEDTDALLTFLGTLVAPTTAEPVPQGGGWSGRGGGMF